MLLTTVDDAFATAIASDSGLSLACSRFQCGGVSLLERLRERDRYRYMKQLVSQHEQ